MSKKRSSLVDDFEDEDDNFAFDKSKKRKATTTDAFVKKTREQLFEAPWLRLEKEWKRERDPVKRERLRKTLEEHQVAMELEKSDPMKEAKDLLVELQRKKHIDDDDGESVDDTTIGKKKKSGSGGKKHQQMEMDEDEYVRVRKLLYASKKKK